MGVVRTIREHLKPSHEIFVCEMGAKYVNDIKEICDLVQPEYGIITSIGPQHLETFGSIENIIKTKFELVDSLKDKTKAVLNLSSKYIKENAPKGAIFYSMEENEGGDYYASDISYGPYGAAFMMCKIGMEPFKIETKLLGKHNIINIVGAASVALGLGLTPQEIAYAVKRLEPVPHRLQLKRQSGGITVIDDAFNSNVEGAKSAVEVLGGFPAGGRMLITPGMIELGEKEFEYNYNFGRQAAKSCDFIILVGEKQALPIKKGILDEGFNDKNIYVAENLNDALVKMREKAEKGWTVLFENDLPDLYDN
jgi:UDP-N-acetylmuramoyl-tripeptide--D-alanyl-D-alanine ligase